MRLKQGGDMEQTFGMAVGTDAEQKVKMLKFSRMTGHFLNDILAE